MSDTAPSIRASEGFWSWLDRHNLSLGFTTYQTNRLFLVGRKPNGRLSLHERLFDKPMGLYARGNDLYMACRYQLWHLRNILQAGEMHQGHDRLYVPKTAHITGDLNVHDLVVTPNGKYYFINTDFSCLATLNPNFSFEPVWQPPFISKLASEDRCHLNGLAMINDEPAFVTACSQSDSPAGWRDHRQQGGVVVHIPDNEIVASGLSMPHSPRWHQDKLWLLNSGTGELGYLDQGRFIAVAFCPGFVRGLALLEDFAVVGLSHLRSRPFSGLQLEYRLQELQQKTHCGLAVINIHTGELLHSLSIDSVVEELFDVVLLPGVKLPGALGFQDEDIQRLISMPGRNQLLVTKPLVKREVTTQSDNENNGRTRLRFQQVLQLTPQNLQQYAALTPPELQQRWQQQAVRGELVGISVSVDGAMIGLAVAEVLPADAKTDSAAEMLSVFVLPRFRHLNLEPRLLSHLKDLVKLRSH